jgi:hypothetical protein
MEAKIDLELVLQIIDDIPTPHERLAIKLKIYPHIQLNQEELAYIANKLETSVHNVLIEIQNMYSQKSIGEFGLRDQDIAKLLKVTSFTNQKERAVRKYIEPLYNYIKSSGK